MEETKYINTFKGIKQGKEEKKMEANKKLEAGEKYLTISLFGGQIKLAAFPNKRKQTNKDPDFLGGGVSVWVNTKQEKVIANEI